MSEALYEFGGLRFWNENEIVLRELFVTGAIFAVKNSLLKLNPAWCFHQVEGPILTPKCFIADHYGEDDIFITNHKMSEDFLSLRPETTASSYVYAKSLNKKFPICVYQKGKSFRRELNDGATASKLRFNEFWQLEFQCIYSKSTMADYRAGIIPSICNEVERFTKLKTRVVPSDRLPSYSESTYDIEVDCSGISKEISRNWIEIASCSIRSDFSDTEKVCEIAIGLDRVATLSAI